MVTFQFEQSNSYVTNGSSSQVFIKEHVLTCIMEHYSCAGHLIKSFLLLHQLLQQHSHVSLLHQHMLHLSTPLEGDNERK